MEDHRSKNLGQVIAKPELKSGDAEGWQNPYPKHNRENFLEEGHAKDSVSLGNDPEESHEPDKGYSDEEIDDGLSEKPCG